MLKWSFRGAGWRPCLQLGKPGQTCGGIRHPRQVPAWRGLRQGGAGSPAVCRARAHVTADRPRVQAGGTALIVSASNGNLEMARLLLESKADIHAADKVP